MTEHSGHSTTWDANPAAYDTDAGGNCRNPACGYNSDAAHFSRAEEDVYLWDDGPGDGETVTFCSLVLPDADIAAHLRDCAECQDAQRRQMGNFGPPGYSAGLAELGYDGDG